MYVTKVSQPIVDDHEQASFLGAVYEGNVYNEHVLGVLTGIDSSFHKDDNRHAH
jgi:hypothetical protein